MGVVAAATAAPLTAAAARLSASPAFVWAGLPALSAWAILGLLQATPGLSPPPLCVSPGAGVMEGWQARIAAAFGSLDPAGWAASSLLMGTAMMLPLAAPMIGHVAARSFAARRRRTVAAFVAGFGLIWLAALAATTGALLVVQASLPAGVAEVLLVPALSVAAALWQISAAKVRAVNRCHGVVALRARGPAADRDAIGFGLLHGARCMRACLPTMAPLLVMPHGPLAMAAVSVVLLAERARVRPQYRLSALVLLLLPFAGGAA